MQQNLGIAHFFQQADAVAYTIIAIMFIMSCGTWYIIVTKSIHTLSLLRKSRRFMERFWSAPSLESVHALIKEEGAREPFSRLVQEGLSATDVHRLGEAKGLSQSSTHEDYLTRSLKRTIEEDGLRLESGLSFMATVASSAPFIGLFGTVWGIYNALIAIGRTGQGTLDKVAGPVGEALIMTAIGLGVAIPAAIAYNFFARTNRGLQGRLDSFAHDVYTLLSKGVKTIPADRSQGGQ